MKKFWNFIRNDSGERVLRLEGPIDEDNFWGDTISPAAFRDDLESAEGDLTVWINSPGGNVFCAAEIYNMLRDHKGRITVKIDAIAASAASVVAMAGDTVLMSPVSMLMIHDPMTMAMGNTRDMEKAITTLNEVKESIINAYQAKSGLSRKKIAQLMEDETWISAKKAVEYGFADAILFSGDADSTEEKKGESNEEKVEDVWKPYSSRAMGRAILNRLIPAVINHADAEEAAGAAEDHAENVESQEAGDPDLTDGAVTADTGDAGLTESSTNPTAAMSERTDNTAADTDEPSVTDTVSAGIDEPLQTDSSTEPVVDTLEESDGVSADTGEPGPTDANASADTGSPGLTETSTPNAAEGEAPQIPVIGMNGKTQDGAMPYEILREKLDWMK